MGWGNWGWRGPGQRAAWIGARWLAANCLALLLFGCSSNPKQDGGPRGPIDFSKIPDAVPKVEPLSKYGNPPSYLVDDIRYYPMESSAGYQERGIASWYGTKFHGKKTSSGDPYDMYSMTAAHKTLPLPTYARVTNLRNGRSIVIRINDRGPFVANRVIDLSYVAAGKLGILENGTGLVDVTAIDPLRPTDLPPVQYAATDSASPARTPSPTPVAPEARPIAPAAAAPTQSSGPTLYLQVGAFASRQNAERLRERVQGGIGATVRVQSSQKDGLSIYRVQIGPLASVDAVDDLTNRLQELNISGAQVRID